MYVYITKQIEPMPRSVAHYRTLFRRGLMPMVNFDSDTQFQNREEYHGRYVQTLPSSERFFEKDIP